MQIGPLGADTDSMTPGQDMDEETSGKKPPPTRTVDDRFAEIEELIESAQAYEWALQSIIIELMRQLIRDGTLGWARAQQVLENAIETHPSDDDDPVNRHSRNICSHLLENLYRELVPRDDHDHPLLDREGLDEVFPFRGRDRA